MSKNECVPSVGALCGDHVLSHIESFMFFFLLIFHLIIIIMLIRLSRRRTNSERNTVHGRDSKRRFHVGFPVSKVRYYRLPCMGRMDCDLSAFASGRNVALLVISISFGRCSTDGMVKHLKFNPFPFPKINQLFFNNPHIGASSFLSK